METKSPKRNYFVDILAILFGIGSWTAANSVFVQLPLLVLSAPEGWNLASYIVIMIQLANLGPILYGFLRKFNWIRDHLWIFFLLGLNVVSTGCMVLFHDTKISIFNSERSGVLLILVFCFALVGCTSSVLFMPYMGRFQEDYLITYLIGEGLSGFLPSVIALLQGVGGNTVCIEIEDSKTTPYTPPPRFNIETFFSIILSLLITSFIAFLILENFFGAQKQINTNGKSYLVRDPDLEIDSEVPLKKEHESKAITTSSTTLTSLEHISFLILLGIVCMLSIGFFPAIMIYSALPYGNITYHLVVTLNSIANPIACFLAFFVPHTSRRNIFVLTSLTVPLILYATLTALMSPAPPLINHLVGGIFVVVVWTLIGGLFSFIRLSITTIFRSQGGNALIWIGAMTQIGAFSGAIISFSLVNFTDFFKPFEYCK